MNKKVSIKILLVLSIFFVSAVAFAEEKSKADQVGVFVKDSALTTQIKSKLLATKNVDSLRIHVDTDSNGIVVLSGSVKSEAQKKEVHDIAHSVDGVKKVINDLTINPNP